MVNICLIGFMGCGKSTIAELLKQELFYDVLDVNKCIIKAEGMPIMKIINDKSEQYYLDLQSKLIQNYKSEFNNILVPGYSFLKNIQDVRHIKNYAKTIFLRVDGTALFNRIAKVHGNDWDPKSYNKKLIEHLITVMNIYYENMADAIVDTSNKTIDQVFIEVLDIVNEFNKLSSYIVLK